jgi:hypothetical protein
MKSLFLAALLGAGAFSASIALADNLDVPIIESAGDGQAANCLASMVSGIKPGPDGFLAVRSGPGSQYRKLDELHNGEIVTVFEGRGNWLGIVYRTANVRCNAWKAPPMPPIINCS